MRNYNKKRDTLIDKYDKIVNRSIDEIQFIRNTYKWYLGIVGSIILIAIAITYFLLSDNIQGYEKIIDKKFTGILIATEKTQDSLNTQFVDQTNRSIKDLVAKNFSDKEIIKTIKTVASEKVDNFSNNYLDLLVEQKVTPKLNKVTKELDNSDAKIQLIEFYLSKVAAFTDDRYSFEKLIEISNSKNHLYSKQANQIVTALISRYSLPKIQTRYGLYLTDSGRDFGWSFKKCYDSYFNYPKEERITILDNVFYFDRFTEREKIKIAMLALELDESLTVVRKASDFLIEIFNLKYANLQIAEIIKAVKQKGYE